MDNQENGPHVRLSRPRRFSRGSGWVPLSAKGERDYYFNRGLIWRAHKAAAPNRRTISYGASIAARQPKYIFEIYPPPSNKYIHTYTTYTTLISNARTTQSLARQSKRSIVRTFAPSVIADSHTLVRTVSPFSPSLYHPSLARGCTHVSAYIYACHPRFTRAQRWRTAMARGRLYTTGKERVSIKRIMNREAASFFFLFLSLFLHVAWVPRSAWRKYFSRERGTINNEARFARGAPKPQGVA